jgi:hypothetical protein
MTPRTNRISTQLDRHPTAVAKECSRDQTNQHCQYPCHLELQSINLEQNTPLGLNSFPVSLSLASLELQVLHIVIVTALCHLTLRLRQSNATVSLSPLQDLPDVFDIVFAAVMVHLLHLGLGHSKSRVTPSLLWSRNCLSLLLQE